MIVSPLTNSENVTLLKTFPCNQLIQDWKKIFDIDITKELKNYPEIYLYQCNDSKLKFFMPFDIAGSDKLYEQLENFDWYYMLQKWEYDVAIEDLSGCFKVLEVGCGQGAFVDRLCKKHNIDAEGIELNSSAVEFGKKMGISIFDDNIHQLARKKSHSFDALCAFQVLEHIPDCFNFFDSMIKLLKTNGKLIISVPNSLSFPKYCESNLLDQPPHHMTQWNHETFEFITTIFPLKVKHFKIEPLAEYHINWYISIQLSRLPQIKLIQSISHRIAYKILKPILKLSQIRNLISGHTLYVCFEKITKD
ncbi:bifunctional 2-polyprenyl-6-hydroxyphenol methylase/3-demethylubiquinol 3-O-methyltransferase UbiG [Geminocystis sp. NIES-3709]|uniref:class I SAM-dependent methyltransferase n=1 Tax=Geminocystis sp. NIES-3709 TaxID=1617448 RepID=UPI0005FC6374|nr:class I SAM-dependent methyltransferase [Geminocystis sp. NIES-3709]BAQ66183.1 hypothetical protein GM3709_2948 [Geminocystis sp. NIES-3709]